VRRRIGLYVSVSPNFGISVSEVGLRKEMRGHTEFDGIRGEMISDWVLAISFFQVTKEIDRDLL
jgi:hypothetical protein